MAKSAGIFKKKETRPPAKQAAPAQRAAKEQPKKGAIDDAFDEIMEEEKKSEPTKKLFHDTNRLEDELIQYLGEDSFSTENEISPPDAPAEKPPLKINLKSELTRKDSAPLQLRFNRGSEPGSRRPNAGGAVARIEGERPEPKIAPLPPPSPKHDGPLSDEDMIYEMLKSPEFSVKKAPAVVRPLRQPGRPTQQRVLRAPPRVEPAEKVMIMPPVIERAVEIPAEPAPAAAVARRGVAGAPILTEIRREYMTLTLLMRWIEFLLERVTREKLSLVMDYYVSVGWISDKARSEALTYARGEMQDVTKYMQHEEDISDESPELKVSPAAVYKKVDDWRLSADDHLKSLLFITKMAGIEVDRDKLNSLEQSIKRFKENLEGYYGV